MITIKRTSLLINVFIFIIQGVVYGQGSTYAGSYIQSAPIVWTGINNATISKLQITNTTGHCISLINCSNITIEDCKLGPSTGNGVDMDHCTNITITNCSMANIASGVYISIGSGISVTYNDIQNVNGSFPRGQMVQFNSVSGTGNRINYNTCDNISGQSNPEDLINLFKSNGTISDPIQVIGNWLRGGGPSKTGGGMLAGDNGGSYQLLEDNICVNTGNEGIEVAGGHDITVNNNIIYSKKTAVSGVGISVYNQCTDPCYNITVKKNQINWTHHSGVLNNLYNAGKSGLIAGWSTNTYNPNLNSSILPTKIIGRIQYDSIPGSTPKPMNYRDYPNSGFDHSIVVKTTTPNIGLIINSDLKGTKIIEQSRNINNIEIEKSSLSLGTYSMNNLIG